MRVNLEVIDGQKEDIGKRFEILGRESEGIIVGRSAYKSPKFGEEYSQIQISRGDPHLSRWHFMLIAKPPNCYIHDIGSTNHTYVNDFKIENYIKDMVELKDGDIIRAGRTSLKVDIIPEEVKEFPRYHWIECGSGEVEEVKEHEEKPPEEIRAENPEEHIWVIEKEKGRWLFGWLIQGQRRN